MTDDMMNLRTLLEKSSDYDLLREMIGFAAGKLAFDALRRHRETSLPDAPSLAHVGRSEHDGARRPYASVAMSELGHRQ
jgi:hypothetical protein